MNCSPRKRRPVPVNRHRHRQNLIHGERLGKRCPSLALMRDLNLERKRIQAKQNKVCQIIKFLYSYISIIIFEDDAGALWEAIKAHKHQQSLHDYQIGTIQHQMDDQDKLLETLLEENEQTKRQVKELAEELGRLLVVVYKCLGKAEEQIVLLSRAQVVFSMPVAGTSGPPTMTMASTQTEGASLVMATPTTIQQRVYLAIPSAIVPVAQLVEMSPPPITTAPLDLPTIEVQGPTPQYSQEGETGTSLLKVPPAHVEPASTEPDPS